MLFSLPRILGQHVHLLEEIVLVATHRALEKARQMFEHAGFAAALGQKRQADDVDQQRGGQQRIAALPEELQDHLRVEKPLKVDVIRSEKRRAGKESITRW